MKENNIIAALLQLEDSGLTSFEVDFSGSGDSGDIDERRYFKDNENIKPDDHIVDFCEKIENIIIDDYYSYDWYNNDGGRGTLIVNILEKTWEIEGVTYYTEEADASQIGDLDSVIHNLKK